jgi:hypothetical protein
MAEDDIMLNHEELGNYLDSYKFVETLKLPNTGHAEYLFDGKSIVWEKID